ncbi:hypothetical protein [Algivirga pacifica]|uniref:DUF4199 domain-containing protein n=1 Tax=Algivirga pacifica TaxID=1162670 RepID=A0ABP9DFJ9_9BACT
MNSQITKTTFCILAGLGLILGLTVHIISLLGIYIGDSIPFVWMLHLGIFVVWVPAVLLLKDNPELQQLNASKNKNPLKFYGILFKNAPKPVMVISLFFFAYAMINFFLFMQSGGGGVPSIIDGKYVINNHGNIIKELTEAEFFKMKANEIRGFSGHWIAFYSLSMGILWPKAQVNNSSNKVA